MIWSLDSSIDRPTLDQARAAKAAGVGMWWGYLATGPDVNLLAPWSQADFEVVIQVFGRAGAFVSGLDDPAALRQLAQAWGVALLALDDEDAIRPLATPDWRPAFLAALGGGHYGLAPRLTLPAQFRIVAEYPVAGCSGSTWPTSPGPALPHGWQCQGTHTEFGLSVDRSALDDWFGGDTVLDPADPIVKQLLEAANTASSILALGVQTDPITFQPVPTAPRWLVDQVNQLTGFSPGIGQAVKAELDAIQQELAGLVAQGLPPADLQPVQDALARLASHLGVGTA